MNPEALKDNIDSNPDNIEQNIPEKQPEVFAVQPDSIEPRPEDVKEKADLSARQDQADIENVRQEIESEYNSGVTEKPAVPETKPAAQNEVKPEQGVSDIQATPPEGMTRRSFIGTTLRALGALFIGSEMAKSSEALETVEDGDIKDPKYKEGIETLRGYAKRTEPEHPCYYIKKSDGTTEWVDGGSQNKANAMMDLSFIGEHKDYREVELLHNHPSAELPMPPSATDIMEAIRFKDGHKDSQADVRFKVVDSFGTYEYIVDGANEKLKEVQRVGREASNLQLDLLSNIDQENGVALFEETKRLLETMDPASTEIEMHKKQMSGYYGEKARQTAVKSENLSISVGAKKEMEKIMAQERKATGIMNRTWEKVGSGPDTEVKATKKWWKERTAILEKARREQTRENQKLIELWRRNGVIINFTPHKATK